MFFEPGREILLAEDAQDVLGHLRLDDYSRKEIGRRARARVLVDGRVTGAIERGLQIDDLRIQLRAIVLQRRSRSVERNLQQASTSGQSW